MTVYSDKIRHTIEAIRSRIKKRRAAVMPNKRKTLLGYVLIAVIIGVIGIYWPDNSPCFEEADVSETSGATALSGKAVDQADDIVGHALSQPVPAVSVATAAPTVEVSVKRRPSKVSHKKLVLKAYRALRAERYQEAIVLYEKLIARDPTNLAVAQNYAISLAKAGHITQAQQAYQQYVVPLQASKNSSR